MEYQESVSWWRFRESLRYWMNASNTLEAGIEVNLPPASKLTTGL